MPSASLGVEIALPDVERRSEFLEELRTTFEAIAKKYTSDGDVECGEMYRFTLACYPKITQEAT